MENEDWIKEFMPTAEEYYYEKDMESFDPDEHGTKNRETQEG